jgi:hypothetical protein
MVLNGYQELFKTIERFLSFLKALKSFSSFFLRDSFYFFSAMELGAWRAAKT